MRGRGPLRRVETASRQDLKADRVSWEAESLAGNGLPRARGDGLVTDRSTRVEFRGDLRSTSKEAGFPTPVQAEAGSVPSHEGSRGGQS